MIAPSDARAIFLEAVAKGEKTPVAYVVGSTPCDFMAAVCMNPPMDELEVLGALRGAPVPIVKCVTNDIYVPADAEYVLEGYLDPKGHAEPEGPFGEYVGYYGVVKKNPVFHLTAITHRKDALFPDRHHRRQASRPHRHRATHDGEDRIRRLGRPRHRGARAGRVLCDAVERRHVQRPRLDPPARAGRGAQRHRRGVRQHGRGQAGVRVRRRHRRVLRRAVRLGAGDALPGRPRHHPGLGLPRRAARSVAGGCAHRRQDRLRLHHSVRQAEFAGVGHPDGAGDAEGQRPRQKIGGRYARRRPRELPGTDDRGRLPRRPRTGPRARRALFGRQAHAPTKAAATCSRANSSTPATAAGGRAARGSPATGRSGRCRSTPSARR